MGTINKNDLIIKNKNKMANTETTQVVKKKNHHMDKYQLVMIPKDVHTILKTYCDEHGYKLSGLVCNLIKKHCK